MTDSTLPPQETRQQRRYAVWGREIPFRNPHFTGRAKDLGFLRQRLVEGSAAVIGQPAQPLYGLGGVGKTEIAVEYAHRYRDDYTLCWWVRCEREALIVNSLLALGGCNCRTSARKSATTPSD